MISLITGFAGKMFTSPTFWKILVVVALVSGIGFGVWTISAQGKEIGRLKSDLSQTENELIAALSVQDAMRLEQNRVQQLLSERERERTLLQKHLSDRGARLRQVEKELDRAKYTQFLACLDVAVPGTYLDELRTAPNASENSANAASGPLSSRLPQTGAERERDNPRND